MNKILGILALVAFVIGAVICQVDDTPDVIDLFTVLFVGLGLTVAALMLPDGRP